MDLVKSAIAVFLTIFLFTSFSFSQVSNEDDASVKSDTSISITTALKLKTPKDRISIQGGLGYFPPDRYGHKPGLFLFAADYLHFTQKGNATRIVYNSLFSYSKDGFSNDNQGSLHLATFDFLLGDLTNYGSNYYFFSGAGLIALYSGNGISFDVGGGSGSSSDPKIIAVPTANVGGGFNTTVTPGTIIGGELMYGFPVIYPIAGLIIAKPRLEISVSKDMSFFTEPQYIALISFLSDNGIASGGGFFMIRGGFSIR